MRFTFFILVVSSLFCVNFLNAQNHTYEWAKSMGGTFTDRGYSLTTDAFGNVYTTGYFRNTVDFNPGPGTTNLTSIGSNDVFVQKMDANGNLLWVKQIAGTDFENSLGIAVDSAGNTYITGLFQGTTDFDPGPGVANYTSLGGVNLFVQKMDANGNFLWAKHMLGNSDGIGLSIQLDSAANIFITGSFESTVDFDPGIGTAYLASSGGEDIFVQKLDTDGNYLWAKRLGGPGNDIGYSIAVDNSGNVYTTGQFFGTVDFDPGVGTINLNATGASDIFVQKMDGNGNFMWAKHFGGASNSPDKGAEIVVSPLGDIYVTGEFYGPVDFDPGPGTTILNGISFSDIFVLKVDSNGNFIWAKEMGGALGDRGVSVASDINDNVYTLGNFFNSTVDFDPGPGTANLTSVGGNGIFMQKLDVNGDFLWVKQIGGSGFSEFPQSITLDVTGNIYATGSFQTTADFDPGSGTSNLISVGNEDIFVLKLSPCPLLTGTHTINACNSYTWIDGNTYTSSNNTATFSVSGAATYDCDSLITLDLTISNSTTGTDTRNECDSYTWIDGNTYTSDNNTAVFNIVGGNASGCDSIVTLNLTILPSAVGTDIRTECSPYTWIDGNTYTSDTASATYNMIGGAVNGCDSLLTLNLTIESVNTNTTSSGVTVISDAVNADYQWLDCDNAWNAISGETNQSLVASSNGNYAVEITENGCVDTSNCVAVTTVGIIENSLHDHLVISPNPTNGEFSVEFDQLHEKLTIRLLSLSGQILREFKVQNTQEVQLDLNEPNGTYLLEITNENGQKGTFRIVKE